MKTLENRIVIAHEDYEILNNYLRPVTFLTEEMQHYYLKK